MNPIRLRIPKAELGARVRERFGGELRRSGSFAQLSMLGATTCLDGAPPASSLGVLWASTYGAREAARAALAEAASGEPVMPFTFIATQPHLAATLLAQRGAPVTRAAFLHVPPPRWSMLLDIAGDWLGSCEAVLLGWVEEAAGTGEHQSDWCLLQGGIPRAARGALPETFSDWLTSA
jgi:hypothetical protein